MLAMIPVLIPQSWQAEKRRRQELIQGKGSDEKQNTPSLLHRAQPERPNEPFLAMHSSNQKVRKRPEGQGKLAHYA